ncbi:hypothetical protein [Parabacteroides faecis]|uniref:hypothetical protein n=1 Tax=Parabacteroides faecis TaxID=1217282 RepID=UPI00352081CB
MELEETINKKVKFEMLNNDEYVTIKRVSSSKDKKNRGIQSSVDMYYMSEEDLNKLHEIEDRIQKLSTNAIVDIIDRFISKFQK